MAVIDKRKGRNGQTVYRVRVRLQGKPLRTATFPTRAEARHWGRETEATLHRECYFTPEHTCAELFAYYGEHILFSSMAALRTTLQSTISYVQTMKQKGLSLIESARKAKKEAKLTAARMYTML